MYERNCPECNAVIKYKNKYNLQHGTQVNAKCKSCRKKPENNYFYNKSHSEEVKNKIRKVRTGSKLKDSTKQKLSEKFSGNKNRMYGRSVYSIWEEKYGKEEADRRLEITKSKHSQNNSGEGNPMYGKPTPNGSGNGWKGWYKGQYFRSLRELTFMIQHDGRFISAEKIRIKYKFNEKQRTYAPDFIIGTRLIEIKPIKLHDSPNNVAKFEAAEKYCEENGLTFEIVDVTIDAELIKQNLEHIKFQNGYLEKFQRFNNESS